VVTTYTCCNFEDEKLFGSYARVVSPKEIDPSRDSIGHTGFALTIKMCAENYEGSYSAAAAQSRQAEAILHMQVK
jgi:hypothetical protein